MRSNRRGKQTAAASSKQSSIVVGVVPEATASVPSASKTPESPQQQQQHQEAGTARYTHEDTDSSSNSSKLRLLYKACHADPYATLNCLLEKIYQPKAALNHSALVHVKIRQGIDFDRWILVVDPKIRDSLQEIVSADDSRGSWEVFEFDSYDRDPKTPLQTQFSTNEVVLSFINAQEDWPLLVERYYALQDSGTEIIVEAALGRGVVGTAMQRYRSMLDQADADHHEDKRSRHLEML